MNNFNINNYEVIKYMNTQGGENDEIKKVHKKQSYSVTYGNNISNKYCYMLNKKKKEKNLPLSTEVDENSRRINITENNENGYGYKRCYLSLSNKCKAGVNNFHYWSYKGLNLLTHYIDKVDTLLDDDERGYVRTLSRDNANRQTLLAKSFINVFSIELVQRIINKYNFIEKLCNQLIQNHC